MAAASETATATATATAAQPEPAESKQLQEQQMDYLTPYLICTRCNAISFVNVHRIRPIDFPKATQLDRFEQIPSCSKCGSSKYLRAGVQRFLEKIAAEQDAIREFEAKRIPATLLLQRLARGFLARQEFQRRRQEQWDHQCRLNNAARLIQKRVRGMQARRRMLVERCLFIIQNLHPNILKSVLQPRPHRMPVFWYDNAAEVQVFFWNYREFVRRSGGRPPLSKVESNVIEIATRMLAREHELVSRIQARWRGLATRLIYYEFRRQQGWHKGIQQSPAIKIQRLVRQHKARKFCRSLRVSRRFPGQMESYRVARRLGHVQFKTRDFKTRILARYRQEFQWQKTSKMINLTTNAFAPTPQALLHCNYSLQSEVAQRRGGTTALADLELQKHKLPVPRSDQNGMSNPFSQLRQRMNLKKSRLTGHIAKAQQLYSPRDTVKKEPIDSAAPLKGSSVTPSDHSNRRE